jgi:hypothetical protein
MFSFDTKARALGEFAFQETKAPWLRFVLWRHAKSAAFELGDHRRHDFE